MKAQESYLWSLETTSSHLPLRACAWALLEWQRRCCSCYSSTVIVVVNIVVAVGVVVAAIVVLLVATVLQLQLVSS